MTSSATIKLTAKQTEELNDLCVHGSLPHYFNGHIQPTPHRSVVDALVDLGLAKWGTAPYQPTGVQAARHVAKDFVIATALGLEVARMNQQPISEDRPHANAVVRGFYFDGVRIRLIPTDSYFYMYGPLSCATGDDGRGIEILREQVYETVQDAQVAASAILDKQASQLRQQADLLQHRSEQDLYR